MGVAVFARPVPFFKSDSSGTAAVLDGLGGGGDAVALNSLKILNKKLKQGYSTSIKRYAIEKWATKLRAGKKIEHCRSSPPGGKEGLVENRVLAKNRKKASRSPAQEIGNLLNQKERTRGAALGIASDGDRLVPKVGGHGNFKGVVTALRPEYGEVQKGSGIEAPNGGGRGWKILGGVLIGAMTMATGQTALKGVRNSSAHASVGDGGIGQSGSGGGGGRGWDGGADSGGSGGNGFSPDSIYISKSEQEDNVSEPAVFSKKIPFAGRPSLASLSSAAGDFMDGEAPIVGDHTSRKYRAADSHQMVEQSNSRNHPFSPQDRQSFVELSRYDQKGDTFVSSGEAQERPSSSSFPAAAGGVLQDGRRRNVGYAATRSGPYSGKPETLNEPYKEDHNSYQTYPRVPSKYPDSTINASSFDSQNFPSLGAGMDFPSLPGNGQERTLPDYQPLDSGNDFSGWVSGLFDSVLGKRLNGQENGSTGDKTLDDDEKKRLVAETAALALKLVSEKIGGEDVAKKFETNALRRLQRETFADLLRVRERLDKLEFKTGLRGKANGDATAGARTNLRGEVRAGGAFVIAENSSSDHSRASIHHAGLKTGLDALFTFETPMRESDMLTTQCGVGEVSRISDGGSFGGPISLRKINYLAQLNDSLSVSIAPLGAQVSDMSDTVNHLQGQALTTFAGNGPALYQHCNGSAIGASLRCNNVLLSMSQFLSGWGSTSPDIMSEPLCLSTLAQFMVQPCDQMVLSLSAVNNVWPSPPSPSSSELHWSEMGPLILCKSVSRPTGAFYFNPLRSSPTNSIISQGNLPTESWSSADSRRSQGIAMQSVALAGEVDLGYSVSLGGWVQVERGDWLQELGRKEFQWNLSLAKCTGQNVNWGLSIGRKKREDWHDDGLSSAIPNLPSEPSSSQLQMEAFVKLRCGKSFDLQSGLVYLVDKHSQTPALVLRSSWTL